MVVIHKLWNFLFSNFMWLYFIVGIARLYGIFVPLQQLFMIVCFLYGLLTISKIKRINSLDLLVFLYTAYVIINSIVIDYPHHNRFLIQAFIFQFCPLMCYFIARSNELEVEMVLKKMMVPLTIAMVLGIYFHLVQPQWYLTIKWNVIYDRYGEYVNDQNVIEHMRLTSIWNSSYYIAYATMFFSAFLLYSLMFKEIKSKEQKLYVALLFLCVVVIIYANHRVTILGFLITYVYCYIRGRNKKLRGRMLFGAAIISIIFIFIIFSSPEYLDYIKTRFTGVTTEAGLQERLEHTGGEQELFTTFGHGYGRHSLRAREYGWWAIIDSEYQKHLGELGVVGFSIFILILLSALPKAFKKQSYAGLELCLYLFYLEAFIGASALSVDSEYSFIFWYVLGKINLKSINRRIIPQTIESLNPRIISPTIQS